MSAEKVQESIPKMAASPATDKASRKFRVGLSADFFNADKTPKFPSFDLTPLKNNDDVVMVIVPVRKTRRHAFGPFCLFCTSLRDNIFLLWGNCWSLWLESRANTSASSHANIGIGSRIIIALVLCQVFQRRHHCTTATNRYDLCVTKYGNVFSQHCCMIIGPWWPHPRRFCRRHWCFDSAWCEVWQGVQSACNHVYVNMAIQTHKFFCRDVIPLLPLHKTRTHNTQAEPPNSTIPLSR